MGLNNSEDMPILTVIVPLFNAKRYVEACIHNLQKQDFREFEAILVDDGSQEELRDIYSRLASDDARFNYIKSKHKGPAAARNIGLDAAKGSYIVFMDADDSFCDEHSLSHIKAAITEGAGNAVKADIISFDYERISEDGTKTHMRLNFGSNEDCDTYRFRFDGFFATGHLAYVWAKAYRRDFLERYELRFSEVEYAEDKLFNFMCYAHRPRYYFSDKCIYRYTRMRSSYSNIYRVNLTDIWYDISVRFERYIRDIGSHPEDLDLCAYTMCFGIYFSAKQEIVTGGGRRGAYKVLKAIGEDDHKMRYVRWLASGRYIRKSNRLLYRTGIPIFCRMMIAKHYGLLATGIAQVVKHGMDEKMYSSAGE